VHFPDDLSYAESHEWARVDPDGTVRVGISDFAQDQLGDVVFVELPEVGKAVAAGEPFGEVESTKSVSEVYAPIAGTITAVNEALFDAPEVVNSDPYGDGWFIEITPAEGAALEGLLDAAGYEATTE
jgi:glycine cleavage system H protein